MLYASGGYQPYQVGFNPYQPGYHQVQAQPQQNTGFFQKLFGNQGFGAGHAILGALGAGLLASGVGAPLGIALLAATLGGAIAGKLGAKTNEHVQEYKIPQQQAPHLAQHQMAAQGMPMMGQFGMMPGFGIPYGMGMQMNPFGMGQFGMGMPTDPFGMGQFGMGMPMMGQYGMPMGQFGMPMMPQAMPQFFNNMPFYQPAAQNTHLKTDQGLQPKINQAIGNGNFLTYTKDEGHLLAAKQDHNGQWYFDAVLGDNIGGDNTFREFQEAGIGSGEVKGNNKDFNVIKHGNGTIHESKNIPKAKDGQVKTFTADGKYQILATKDPNTGRLIPEKIIGKNMGTRENPVYMPMDFKSKNATAGNAAPGTNTTQAADANKKKQRMLMLALGALALGPLALPLLMGRGFLFGGNKQ
jgi:hypothetical protein